MKLSILYLTTCLVLHHKIPNFCPRTVTQRPLSKRYLTPQARIFHQVLFQMGGKASCPTTVEGNVTIISLHTRLLLSLLSMAGVVIIGFVIRILYRRWRRKQRKRLGLAIKPADQFNFPIEHTISPSITHLPDMYHPVIRHGAVQFSRENQRFPRYVAPPKYNMETLGTALPMPIQRIEEIEENPQRQMMPTTSKNSTMGSTSALTHQCDKAVVNLKDENVHS